MENISNSHSENSSPDSFEVENLPAAIEDIYIPDLAKVEAQNKKLFYNWRPKNAYDQAPIEVQVDRFEDVEIALVVYEKDTTEESCLALVKAKMRMIGTMPGDNPKHFALGYRNSIERWKELLMLTDTFTDNQVNNSIRLAKTVSRDGSTFATDDERSIALCKILNEVRNHLLREAISLNHTAGKLHSDEQNMTFHFQIGDILAVKRSSGDIEQGWSITDFVIGEDNKQYAVLHKQEDSGASLEKIVRLKDLEDINKL